MVSAMYLEGVIEGNVFSLLVPRSSGEVREFIFGAMDSPLHKDVRYVLDIANQPKSHRNMIAEVAD